MAGNQIAFNGKSSPQWPYVLNIVDQSGYLIAYQHINGALTVFPACAWDNSLTAAAGGGQANAFALNYRNSRFTTVATIADSAVLPQAVVGMCLSVVNAAANSMNVFPYSGDAINALGANAAFALAGGKTADFYCSNAGQWHSVLSA